LGFVNVFIALSTREPQMVTLPDHDDSTPGHLDVDRLLEVIMESVRTPSMPAADPTRSTDHRTPPPQRNPSVMGQQNLFGFETQEFEPVESYDDDLPETETSSQIGKKLLALEILDNGYDPSRMKAEERWLAEQRLRVKIEKRLLEEEAIRLTLEERLLNEQSARLALERRVMELERHLNESRASQQALRHEIAEEQQRRAQAVKHLADIDTQIRKFLTHGKPSAGARLD
jgi:hypothetical protein